MFKAMQMTIVARISAKIVTRMYGKYRGIDGVLALAPVWTNVSAVGSGVGKLSNSRKETDTISSWLVSVQKKETLRDVKGGSGGQW